MLHKKRQQQEQESFVYILCKFLFAPIKFN